MLCQIIKGKSLELEIFNSFERLPKDQFLNEGKVFRKRRYHTGKWVSNQISWDDSPKEFLQTKALNNYAGGVKRAFDPIESSIRDLISKDILPLAFSTIPESDYHVGVHQIRIITDDSMVGKPAPEGIHQDGFHYVMVTCIKTHNIVGGNSVLVDSKDYNKVFYDRILESGESLIFDDNTYAHYASPIMPKLPGTGFRDVFVTTYKRI